MRLTNEMRSEFVDAVMSATPWKNTMTDALAIGEFEKRAFALLPADVKHVFSKYPGVLAYRQSRVPDMPDALAIHKVKGYSNWRPWSATIPNIVEPKDVKFDDVRKLVLKRDAEDIQRHNLRLQLRGVADHATTVAELEAALPDMKQWLPKPPVKAAKSMALAPLGLVASFKKAGLPVKRALV